MTVQAPARVRRRSTSPFEPIPVIHLAPLPAGHRELDCPCGPIRTYMGNGIVIHRITADPFAQPMKRP